MAVLIRLREGCLVDHEAGIAKVYRQVTDEQGRDAADYSLLPGLFAIMRPFRVETTSSRSRKRKLPSDQDDTSLTDEVKLVKDLFEKLKEELKVILRDNDFLCNMSDEIDAKELSKEIFQRTNFEFGSIRGGNRSETPLRCRINNEIYLVPPMARFMCGSVVEQVEKLDEEYDLVVADPPWWNKYIRRLKTASPSLSYSMMYNEHIASIPLRGRLAAGCVLAVWCTNSPSCVRAVREQLFPAWGVAYAATWYWVKVTRRLEPVCGFRGAGGKQPYERVVLGVAGSEEGRARLPERLLLVSVPSALHSHKPPLNEIISPYLTVTQPRTLELFARYLLPHTTSIGYEPLKWQHLSLYRQLNKDK